MKTNGNPLRVIILFWFCLLVVSPVQAQKVWTNVTLDRTSTYVGQPVVVKISAFTSTWFTRGVDLGNIKVNGAFTVYFRPVSQTIQQDGQTYAGVELQYHVFPYTDEDMVFPSLTVEVETPPEGEFKGVKQTLKTPEKKISVKPIPPTFSQDRWLVATGLRVSDQWNQRERTVKVGEVLERRISRTAFGTVGELIPPIAWDSLAGVSQYPSRSAVENQKTKTAISASRTETMRYLLEETGEVTFPQIVFSWYHPYQEKLYKRTLPAVTFTVEPNPDLGVLASVRDSLAVLDVQEAEAEAEEQPFTILGLTPKTFLILALSTLLLFYLLVMGTRKALQVMRERRDRYRQSEAYYFRQFTEAVREEDEPGIIRTLYRWIDELQLAEPSLYYFVIHFGRPALREDLAQIEKEPHRSQAPLNVNMKEWKRARQRYNRSALHPEAAPTTIWVNPGW